MQILHTNLIQNKPAIYANATTFKMNQKRVFGEILTDPEKASKVMGLIAVASAAIVAGAEAEDCFEKQNPDINKSQSNFLNDFFIVSS